MESQDQFRQARLRRHNQAMLQQQVIPNDFNDPFKYHPPKRTSAKQKSSRKPSSTTTSSTHYAPEVSDSDSDFDDTSSSSSSSAPTLAGYRRLTIAMTVTMYQFTAPTHVTRLGSRGFALAGDEFANSPQTLVAYDLSTKSQFLQVPVDSSFRFTLVAPDSLPAGADRAPAAARFSDGLNDWLIAFSDPAHLADFCMNVAMARNTAQTRASARGAARSTIAQDLCLGAAPSAAEVRVGDKVRVRYSMSSIGAQGRLAAAVAQDVTKTFDVGSGGVPPGVEQGIIGMRKGDVRFLVIPRVLAGAATEWGPHVPGDAELAVEVTLERHKVSEGHAQERADAAAAAAATGDASRAAGTPASAAGAAAAASAEPGAGRRRASMTSAASTGAAGAGAGTGTGKGGDDDIFNAQLVKPGQAYKARASFSAATAAGVSASGVSGGSKGPEDDDDDNDMDDGTSAAAAAEAGDVYRVPLAQAPVASASGAATVPSSVSPAPATATATAAGAGDEEALIDRMRRISEAGHRAALPSAASAGAGTPRLAPMAAAAGRAQTPATGSATGTGAGTSAGTGATPPVASSSTAATAATRAPAPNAIALPAMSLAHTSSGGLGGGLTSLLSPLSPAGPSNSSAAAIAAAVSAGALSAATPASEVLCLLGMDALAPALASHAVDTFDDMTMLEDADWKQVVPQIGARRKLQLRVAELSSLITSNASGVGVGGGLPPPRSSLSASASAADPTAAAAAGPSSDAEAFARSQADARAHAQAEARAAAAAATAATEARDAAARAAEADAAAAARAKGDAARAQADAYEQGRSDAAAAAKARIDAMKDLANEKFAALTAELAAARAELAEAHVLAEELRVALAAAEKEGSKARETMRAYVERTREQRKEDAAELAAAKAAIADAVEAAKEETAELKAQAREYVVKVKEAGKVEKRALVKQVSETVFVKLNEAFNANDVLDGETILSKIKDVIKASAQETLQQID